MCSLGCSCEECLGCVCVGWRFHSIRNIVLPAVLAIPMIFHATASFARLRAITYS